MYKGYAKARVEAIGNIAETRSYSTWDDLDDQENQSPATSLLRACYKPARRPLGI